MIKNIFIPFENTQITGNLHINKGSKTLVIMCHGFGDTKDEPNVKRVAELLDENFNVFRFTFTDHKDPYLPEEKLNIDVVVKYFYRKYEEIVLLGVSLGGLSATLGVLNNKKINKLILVNPFAFFHNKVAWRFRKKIIGMFFAYFFVKKIRDNLNFYFRNFKPQSITIPALLIVAKNDQKVDSIHGKKLYKMIGYIEKKLIIDKEIDHGLTKESYKKTVTGYINNWLKK